MLCSLGFRVLPKLCSVSGRFDVSEEMSGHKESCGSQDVVVVPVV